MIRQVLQAAAKVVAAKARENNLVEYLSLREQFSDSRHRLSQAFGVLRREQRGKAQNAGQTYQKLRVLDQPLLLEDRRQQLLLNVDDEQRALRWIKESTRSLSIGIRNSS